MSTLQVDLAAALSSRADTLAALFHTIATTRMAGLPMLNPALQVQAIGFAPLPAETAAEPPAALGVLLTPWFMNLVHLPLARIEAPAEVGRTRTLRLNGHVLDFIGAHEDALGAFAACSLFSPVFEFARQADALATALAVLAELRTAPRPARRTFLLGRTGAAA